ncbi:hypothetical protein ABIE12_001262 [Serratia sp. 509]
MTHAHHALLPGDPQRVEHVARFLDQMGLSVVMPELQPDAFPLWDPPCWYCRSPPWC